METKKADSIAFAYTVKVLGKADATKEDYAPFFDKLAKLTIPIEYKILERDSHGKIHFHGIIYLKKGFFRRRICLKGFHVKLEELYDRKGWLRYIHKDIQYHHLEQQAEEYESEEYESEDSLISIPDDDFIMPTKRLLPFTDPTPEG